MARRTPVSNNVQPMTDDALLISMGVYDGISALHRFGSNTGIGTADPPVDVWSVSGLYTGFASVPEIVEVFSSAATDTSGNVGARTIRIYGLRNNTSTEYTTEDVILNGVTVVDTVNTWWRVNSVSVLTAGSSLSNAGIITIRQKTTTTNVLASVPIGHGHSSICAWTVPAKTTLFIDSIVTTLGRGGGLSGSAEVRVQVKDANEANPSWNTLYDIYITDGSPVIADYAIARSVKAGWDIVMRVFSVSDNSTNISGSIEGYRVDDKLLF